MNKLIIAALAAASLLPIAAQAQSQDDGYRDRGQQQDPRNANSDPRGGQYRDGGRDQRGGDYRDQGQDRRDPRFAGGDGDRNRAWGHDDWRGWRDHNPGAYARGGWRAPFRYYAFRPGARIAPAYFGPEYVIAEPWRYHLPPARPYTRWVRHYDDVLLVDYRRGVVVDVIRSFYR